MWQEEYTFLPITVVTDVPSQVYFPHKTTFVPFGGLLYLKLHIWSWVLYLGSHLQAAAPAASIVLQKYNSVLYFLRDCG